MTKFLPIWLGLLLCMPLLHADNQSDNPYEMETLINDRLRSFPFHNDNLFRLAAYAEMKGQYSSKFHALTLPFGNLGTLSIYERNCLFRTPKGVFHLDVGQSSPAQVKAMNDQLAYTFDQIILLGNHEAEDELVNFVDRHLAKKNIEPFDKIFLRHLLVKYGRFEKDKKRVVFHSDWLPDTAYVYRGPQDKELVKKHINPLMVKLDEHIVRGYYIKAGGTVYVEDVKRDVLYATGENYLHNVTAFKLFISKLFVQTTHYVVNEEQERLDSLQSEIAIRDVIKREEKQAAYAANTEAKFMPQASNSGMSMRGVSRGGNSAGPAPRKKMLVKSVEPLYHEYSWIPMMLGLLRNENINVGDPDVIRYFVNQPYFQRIYDQMDEKEKAKTDDFLERM